MAHDQPPARREQLEGEMQQLSGRDLQLWLLTFLMLAVLAGGVIALVLPSLFEDLRALEAGRRYLPQLFSGLVALVVLFNAYMLDQHRRLTKARQELVRQMLINERIEQLTLIDPLTGIFNRRYMEQVIPKEISRADRLDSPVTFMLIDLDHFKRINDQFGHQAGDKLLLEVAQLLQRTFRTCDIVLRYGGDEFLVILPDTTEEAAQNAVERLLQQMTRWSGDAHPDIKLSLSCGTAQYRPGDNFNAILRRADESMYAQKARHQTGQNEAAAAGA